MQFFNAIAVLITISAVLSYLNYRYVRWPTTIAIMVMSLLLSVGLILVEGVTGTSAIHELIKGIDFNQTLLVGMLSFLLFAGALHVDINDLLENKLTIGILATLGVVCSCFIVGTIVYAVLKVVGIETPYLYCLLFGALIAPTDPIAVLAILKKAHAPKKLEVTIAGESLFNDGIGVVLFVTLLGLATGGHEVAPGHVVLELVREVLGGAALGLLLGWVSFAALKRVDDYQVEILITLALVAGGYALALKLHTSGPICIVIAGLMIGNHGRRLAMSDTTVHHLDTFWELIDEILNAVLFVLIGLEVMVISLKGSYLLMGCLAIPIVLLARLCAVGLPIQLLKKVRTFVPGTVKVLTWGGLRGGISVALALSLAPGPKRQLLLTMTYLVVVFSLVVQGLTVKHLVKGQE